ncbi:MAG: transposase [Bacteroidaceae bacterium]|nr:transposase [Bacteroidaceae bacterium]
MLKAYKYRIYPTDEQKVLFAKTFGCVRVVYNWGLDLKSKLYKEKKENISSITLINRMVAELKKEKVWLNEVNSQSLQMAIRNLDAAYQKFFKKNGKYPNFKSKHERQSFHNPQRCSVDFKRGILNIPKAKNIKIIFHRKFKGDRIHDVTISKDKDGRYYASILVDTFDKPLPKKPVTDDTAIGIDTGLKTFAVCSNGEEFASAHFLKEEKRKLKLLGRKLSKKKKGSKAFDKTKRSIAKVHSKVARKRLDYLHKITHRLTHENQVGTICVEDLNVKGMVRNKHLAYDISDAGIGMFYTLLAYKCDWYGINLIEIGRFQPSSKRCSCCGYINKTLTLSVRHWTCPECGASHDRDYNASVNIKNFGLETLRMERPEVKPVECPLVDDRASAPKKQRHYERGKVISKRSLNASKSLK